MIIKLSPKKSEYIKIANWNFTSAITKKFYYPIFWQEKFCQWILKNLAKSQSNISPKRPATIARWQILIYLFVNYTVIFFDSWNWNRSCGDECYENIGRPSHIYRVGESGVSWVLLTIAYIVIAVKPVQISNRGMHLGDMKHIDIDVSETINISTCFYLFFWQFWKGNVNILGTSFRGDFAGIPYPRSS